MRLLITGAQGMLGRTLNRHLQEHELFFSDLADCDLVNIKAVEELFARTRPETVLHCAAMTTVDKCETETDQAFQANAVASANVAVMCNRYRSRLIAFSTDYVFSGDSERPYHEWDNTGPINVYGQSKLAGEQAVQRHCSDHLICRISWLYGQGGPSFVHTMLKLGAMPGEVLKVVNDQVGNPTSTEAVAEHIKILLNTPVAGIMHLTCEGEASWFDFTKEIFKLWGFKREVSPCSSVEFPRPARRPKNSRLEKRLLRLLRLPSMPDWREALKQFHAMYPQG